MVEYAGRSPGQSSGRGPRLWAYGYADLARLLVTTEEAVRIRAKRGKIQPGDLESICKAWAAARGIAVALLLALAVAGCGEITSIDIGGPDGGDGAGGVRAQLGAGGRSAGAGGELVGVGGAPAAGTGGRIIIIDGSGGHFDGTGGGAAHGTGGKGVGGAGGATCTGVRPAVCGGVCVDTMTDSANCGGCNGTCDTGSRCISGRCYDPVSMTLRLATFPDCPLTGAPPHVATCSPTSSCGNRAAICDPSSADPPGYDTSLLPCMGAWLCVKTCDTCVPVQ